MNATIEEVRYELPWILDLSKSLALLSSKCAGIFIKAPSEKQFKIGRIERDWLENDLLSQVLEYHEKDENKECTHFMVTN